MSRRLRGAATWLLLGWGAVLVARPERAAGAVLGGGPVPPTPVIRVLGARRLAQEALLLARPTPAAGFTACAVDVLHALSMVPAVLLWPEYRRAALTTAGIATGSAVLAARGAIAARRAEDLWAPR